MAVKCHVGAGNLYFIPYQPGKGLSIFLKKPAFRFDWPRFWFFPSLTCGLSHAHSGLNTLFFMVSGWTLDSLTSDPDSPTHGCITGSHRLFSFTVLMLSNLAFTSSLVH